MCGSELDAAIRSKQDTLKQLEAEESVESPKEKAELRAEDLGEASQAVSKADCKGACHVRSEAVTPLKIPAFVPSG